MCIVLFLRSGAVVAVETRVRVVDCAGSSTLSVGQLIARLECERPQIFQRSWSPWRLLAPILVAALVSSTVWGLLNGWTTYHGSGQQSFENVVSISMLVSIVPAWLWENWARRTWCSRQD